MTKPVPSPAVRAAAEAVEALRTAASAAHAQRAISDLEKLANEGDSRALERSALFAAMGCGRAQDWGEALALLGTAAAAGSDFALAQQQVLAGRNIEEVLRVPPREVLSESPHLRVFRGFASAAECDWVIGRASERLGRAVVFDPNTGEQREEGARTNSSVAFQVADMDVVLEVLRWRIASALHLPVPLLEPTQVLHYASGQQFSPHHDYFDPETPGGAAEIAERGQRIATVLIYLNDGYEGGATEFPVAGLKFCGNAGDALFLANVGRDQHPDASSLHAGAPVESGVKWILSQWIRNRPPAS